MCSEHIVLQLIERQGLFLLKQIHEPRRAEVFEKGAVHKREVICTSEAEDEITFGQLLHE